MKMVLKMVTTLIENAFYLINRNHIDNQIIAISSLTSVKLSPDTEIKGTLIGFRIKERAYMDTYLYLY